MKQFNVKIQKVEYSFATLTVEAENQEEAQVLAEKKSDSCDFNGNYDETSIIEIS